MGIANSLHRINSMSYTVNVKVAKFQAVILAALERNGGQGTASEVYQCILESGERAVLANVYVALGLLEDKKAIICKLRFQETPDGMKREVKVFSVTAAGRAALADAVSRLDRTLSAMRNVSSNQ